MQKTILKTILLVLISLFFACAQVLGQSNSIYNSFLSQKYVQDKNMYIHDRLKTLDTSQILNFYKKNSTSILPKENEYALLAYHALFMNDTINFLNYITKINNKKREDYLNIILLNKNISGIGKYLSSDDYDELVENGDLAFHLEGYEIALQEYHKALKSNRSYKVLTYIGDTYVMLKKLDTALYYYDNALALLDTVDDKVFIQRVLESKIYVCFNLKQYGYAHKTLIKLFSLDANKASYWRLLGDLEMQVYDYNKAIKHYKKAMSLNDTSEDLKVSLATAYYHTGSKTEYCNLFKELVQRKDLMYLCVE